MDQADAHPPGRRPDRTLYSTEQAFGRRAKSYDHELERYRLPKCNRSRHIESDARRRHGTGPGEYRLFSLERCKEWLNYEH